MPMNFLSSWGMSSSDENNTEGKVLLLTYAHRPLLINVLGVDGAGNKPVLHV